MNRNRMHPSHLDPNSRATFMFEAAVVIFLLALWVLSR